MSFNRDSKRKNQRLKWILLSPFYALVEIVTGIRDAGQAILHFTGLKRRIPRRRNKDFERAGQERPRGDGYDASALSNLEKADRQRNREVLERVVYEKRTLRKKNKEGEQLRQSMLEENRSVSSGATISHLAKMNQREKAKRKQTRNDEQDARGDNSATPDSEPKATD